MTSTPTTQPILVEVAPGELIDKITILQIKTERIDDSVKLRNVKIELEVLQKACAPLPASTELDDLSNQLKSVNEELWGIEDDIRDCERGQDFGETFVKLARAVYHTNDRRASLKKQINEHLGSKIVEEKSYADY